MCFTNSIDNLTKFRNSKRKFIIVWKLCNTDHKTGLAQSCYNGERDQVWWKKGETVVPHRICEPLRPNRYCGAGLYFYTSKQWLPDGYRTDGYRRVVIKARVKPEDIIGVNHDASELCCVAAHVLQAPNPDQTKIRIKYLRRKITHANNEFKEQQEEIAVWEAEEPDKQEALQNMRDEVKELKG